MSRETRDFLVRKIDARLHESLKTAARKNGRSMSKEVIALIERALGRK